MISAVLLKNYSDLPFCQNEILRYSGCKNTTPEISVLLNECMDIAKSAVDYKVCYRVFDVKVCGDRCDFGSFKLSSQKLAANLAGCDKAVLFAATLGVGVDRIIAKHSKLEPSKALMLHSIGTAQIEALCDAFCADICLEYNTGIRPRFSPGYGDLSLDYQKNIFKQLDCERKIGLTLNDSLLMSPSKSVTAVVGLCESKKSIINKCSACDKYDCTFRGI